MPSEGISWQGWQKLSVKMSVRNGDVILLSVVQQREGKLILLCAEGESVKGQYLKLEIPTAAINFQSEQEDL